MARILVIDDDVDFCISFQRMLQHIGHICDFSLNIQDGIHKSNTSMYDLLFLDVCFPDGNGIHELQSFKTALNPPEIIILTGQGDPDGAGMAINNGAWDYIEKPISILNLKLILRRTLHYRQKKLAIQSTSFDRSSIIGNSNKLNACLDVLAKAANSHSNVIISGETGTGKELFARAIHDNSSRKGDLIVIDCTNLPKTLAESLLFGHVKGSFTGAYDTQEGLFKQADGGTVFLDEVGEMSQGLQKTLLRVLQEKKFRPIGAKKEVHSNFRVIAASNKNLSKMVEAGHFRSDLYFRLAGLRIDLPPLRERPEDIKLITVAYIKKICREYQIENKSVSEDFIDALMTYSWPGNVRELINVLYASVDNAYDEPLLYPHHLSMDLRVCVAKNAVITKNKNRFSTTSLQESKSFSFCMQSNEINRSSTQNKADLNHILEGFDSFPTMKQVREIIISQMEASYLKELGKVCQGKIPRACRICGLSRARLYELLKKHDINFVR